MDYLGLFTAYHIAKLQDWISESGELYVDFDTHTLSMVPPILFAVWKTYDALFLSKLL